MIPCRCAYSSPAHACAAISTAVPGRWRAVALQQLRARLALDVLHDDEVAAGVDAGVVDLDDVGVDELGDGERLAAEPGDELLVVGEVLGQHLDGDRPLEHPVGGLVDGRHAAAAEPVARARSGSPIVPVLIAAPCLARRRSASGFVRLRRCRRRPGWCRRRCRRRVRGWSVGSGGVLGRVRVLVVLGGGRSARGGRRGRLRSARLARWSTWGRLWSAPPASSHSSSTCPPRSSSARR